MTVGHDPDAAVISRLAARDEGALRELYRRHSSAVYGLAKKITSDAHTAEEVTADVFLKVSREAASYRESAAGVTPWLLRITRNAAIDATRRRKHVPRPASDAVDFERAADDTPAPIDKAAMGEFRVAVRRALEEIPEGPRKALALAYFSGLTQSEIATKLEVPLGTAKTWVRTGLMGLRERLQGFLEIEPAETTS